jgi:hypothetical protein
MPIILLNIKFEFLFEIQPTFVDRGCRVVSATDPHGPYSRFSSPEPLLFLPSSFSIVLIRTRDLWICSPKLRPLDHRGIVRFRTKTTEFFFYLKCSNPNDSIARTHQCFNLFEFLMLHSIYCMRPIKSYCQSEVADLVPYEEKEISNSHVQLILLSIFLINLKFPKAIQPL